MPDDRLIHLKFGRGQRASKLTHFEFRVWVQFLVSSDDYGVMLYSVAPLQSDNVVLAKEKPGPLMKALARLIEVGLVVPFDHQGLSYICAPDWQDFQKVRYPRDSHQPCPPAEIIETFKKSTRDLFARHPRNPAAIVREDSGNISEIDQSLPCAGAQETAYGLRQTANGSRPTANESTAVAPFRPRGVQGGSYAALSNLAYRHPDRGVTLNRGQFYDSMVAQFGTPDAFHAWLDALVDRQPPEWKCGDTFKFIRDAIDAEFGSKQQGKGLVSRMQRASEAFIAAGGGE